MRIEVQPDEKSNPTYPWVGELATNDIGTQKVMVLFLGPDVALTLRYDMHPRQVGDVSNNWDPNQFAPFRGKVTFICH